MNESDETVTMDVPPLPVAVGMFGAAVEAMANAGKAWKQRPGVITGNKLRAAMDALETATMMVQASVPTTCAMARAEIDAVLWSQRVEEVPDTLSRLALPPADWKPVNGEHHAEADDDDPDVKWGKR